MANIRIAELDFDQIKNNLKNFLQSQEEFTDYDFEGSGLSILLDILAYNTHYNAFYANMLINEMFLDSAVKRASAVSLAKHLGYTTASARGARAVVDITVRNPLGTPAFLTLEQYTPFLTVINGTPYTFFNLEPLTITPAAGNYNFLNTTIVEGSIREIDFVSVEPGTSEKFEIPDINVDTTTMLVTVQNSVTDTETSTYVLSDDIVGLNSESKVYFLEENPFGRYQIYFGDDIIGKKLSYGNLIKIKYLVAAADNPNVSSKVIQTFTTNLIGGSSDITVTTRSNSNSAAQKENITSIKFKAPLVNAARNRAVTAKDYEALITSQFSDAESVSVWGGEDNDPPKFGKVLISLKPFDGFNIFQTTKDRIINKILSQRKTLAIQPEFVDPEYIFVGLNVNVEFNSQITTKTSSTITNIVDNTVKQYFSTNLQKFNKNFNKSELIKLILQSDLSISSVLISLTVQKRAILPLNVENSFTRESTFKLRTPIIPGTLLSSRFFTPVVSSSTLVNIVDIPNTMPPSLSGLGRLAVIDSLTKSTLIQDVGSVNYGTGEITIPQLTLSGLPLNVVDFRFTASVQEQAQNLKAFRNQILVLDDSDLNAAVGRNKGLTINVRKL